MNFALGVKPEFFPRWKRITLCFCVAIFLYTINALIVPGEKDPLIVTLGQSIALVAWFYESLISKAVPAANVGDFK